MSVSCVNGTGIMDCSGQVVKNNKIISRIKREPYLIINTVFVLIIAGVLVYSLIFSPDEGEYPVACVHEQLTGEPCVSCGLSHSFSLIMRGRFEEALAWNVHGIRIFLFFAAQLLMRILFSLFFLLSPRISKFMMTVDIALSIGFVLYSFWPFLAYIF